MPESSSPVKTFTQFIPFQIHSVTQDDLRSQHLSVVLLQISVNQIRSHYLTLAPLSVKPHDTANHLIMRFSLVFDQNSQFMCIVKREERKANDIVRKSYNTPVISSPVFLSIQSICILQFSIHKVLSVTGWVRLACNLCTDAQGINRKRCMRILDAVQQTKVCILHINSLSS